MEVFVSNGENGGSFSANTERSAKVTAGLLAGLYIVGLIVVNRYLERLGFAAFSYARPQYVFAGAATLIVFAFMIGWIALMTAGSLVTNSWVIRLSVTSFSQLSQPQDK